jgi:catechol 2,3-dioxygenase-like lactoylglutathione lyase family enzyme
MFQELHHIAYRCRDAQETVEFYTQMLGLKYAAGEQLAAWTERRQRKYGARLATPASV